MERPECFGVATFCDDIRQEVGGKLSFMGIYTGTMFLHLPVPATLAKLGCVLSLMRSFSHTRKIPGAVFLKIHLPGDQEDSPSLVGEIPSENIERGLEQILAENDPEIAHLRTETFLTISPLVIKEFGRIRATAVLPDGDIVKLGTLKIVPAPKVETS